ncbi:MAG: flagellar biosynthesis protein FliQ [Clostridiales bacterium]|nr:flagellar biosynthesis protein FliQ [Clostridiales bacterium]
MTQGVVLEIFRDAIFTMLELSLPLLVVSIVIGLVISIFQAATQIHEQTLTFVPKIIAIAFLLLMLGSWMLTVLMELFQRLCQLMITL